ncbi:hypothetical protein KBD33_00965 [Candidatus Gracilibacteria bacterium]|nr:hypothetical protein [Candidatus Gracilibacteria bacterium]
MSDQTKELKALRDLIHSAQGSIQSAKKILSSLLGEDNVIDGPEYDTGGLMSYNSGELQIVEGVFTGENMLGPDGNTYPVPQNYASKSLLVQGSRLKAIIEGNGRIKYKIIEEIPFATHVGIVTKVGEKYQVVTDTKSYNVLMAAITFHKCSVGDTVSIRTPEGKDATYAVIEAIIPKP